MSFSCSANGDCEDDPQGPYSSLEACRADCQPHILPRDLTDLVYQYSPASALGLAPSDQVRIVRQITNLVVGPEAARRILAALETLPQEGSALVREPLLWPYLRRLFSSEVFEQALYDAGTTPAFQELQRTHSQDDLDYHRLLMASLRIGNCELANQIEDSAYGPFIELADEEIAELEALPHRCVLEYLLRVYGNDYYNLERYFMPGAVAARDLDRALMILSFPGVEIQACLMSAASEGGLDFLSQLADEGYYQSLNKAADLGPEFLALALERPGVEDGEIRRALTGVKDEESRELLRSRLA
jgi:hypothetical protein